MTGGEGAAVLELAAVHQRRGGAAVLHGVTLAVRPSEVAVLLGASGSGRTTLLRVVAGLERVESGRVRLRGADADGLHARHFVPPERRGLGMVFQEHALWPHLGVGEKVALGLPPTGGADRAAAAAALLDAVGLRGCRRGVRTPCLAGSSSAWRWRSRWRPAAVRRAAVQPRRAPPRPAAHADRRPGAPRGAQRAVRQPRSGGRVAAHGPHPGAEDGRISQEGTPQALHAAPATATVARYLGAEGHLAVRKAGNDLGRVDG